MYFTILNWLFANLDDFQYFYIDNLCGLQIFYLKSDPKVIKKWNNQWTLVCTLIKTVRHYSKLSFLDKRSWPFTHAHTRSFFCSIDGGIQPQARLACKSSILKSRFILPGFIEGCILSITGLSTCRKMWERGKEQSEFFDDKLLSILRWICILSIAIF